MTDLPAPLTPADCDLQAFRELPLDIGRFRDSELVTLESPEVVLAALHLWCAAWHQIPAASLPADDRVLARLAGYGRAVAEWEKVKAGALRGFVLCSDGRLYHRVLAEKARDKWQSRLQYQYDKARDRHRKAQRDLPEDQRTLFPPFEAWIEDRDAAPRPAAQTPQRSLPLETDSVSAGNPPAFRRNDAPVPPDSRRNEGENPLENALKGREGKGRDSIRESSTPSESRAKGESEKPDLHGITARLARLGGVSIINPSQIARNMDVVKAWIADGLDVETVIVPAIERAVLDAPEGGVHSLGYFDRPIRTAIARKGSAQRKPKAPPAPPLSVKDDDDPGVTAFRAKLPDQVGGIIAAQWLNPNDCAITLNGSAIILNVRSAFHRQHIEANLLDQLKRIAHLAGKDRIRVEVAP